MVNTTNASRTQHFDSRQLSALPFSGIRTFDDLALLAPQVMGSVAAVATAAPESAEATAAAAAERQSIISPLTFWILLGGAVLVLVALIVRLVKTSESPRT